MRTGMSLHLSQPMLEYLCAVADNVTWDRAEIGGRSIARPGSDLVTSASLEKRGLIRRKLNWKPSRDERDAHYELTEAGEAVVLLLKSVGVFVQADAAIGRKA